MNRQLRRHSRQEQEARSTPNSVRMVIVREVYQAQQDSGTLYSRIWRHLWDAGKRQDPIEEIRRRKNGL